MRFADRLPRSQPLFAQDCKHCTFLGTYAGADLYHCACWGSNPTVIARRSNETQTTHLVLLSHELPTSLNTKSPNSASLTSSPRT